MSWVWIIGGIIWYFVWSGIASAVFVKRVGGHREPVPGTGDVSSWISGVAMLGWVVVIVGVLSLFTS
jgi:hypothetical protein